jgi:hypothetical protein
VQPASAACQQFPRVGAAEHVCKTSRGSAPRKRVHGSRLAPPTPEAPDHAVYDAFIRRSVRARYPGCAPREATSRRTNAKQFLFWAERDQLTVIGLVLRDMDVVRLSARHPALAARQHIASGSISFRAKGSNLACVAGRAASRHGRTIDDDARNYERDSRNTHPHYPSPRPRRIRSCY